MTNKVVLKTVEEFIRDYQPVYQPLYPLFLGKSQAYAEEVGKMDFKRVQTVGDIRAKHITPKDSEIRQIAVNEASKYFKKYFLANQYQVSSLQSQEDTSEVIAQVLDENQKLMDDLFLLGEGTNAGNVINNGLYWSSDANYVLETSSEIDTDADPLIGMHSKLMENVQDAKNIAGQKNIIFYGSEVLAKLNSLFASQPVPFKDVLTRTLGAGFNIVEMPSEVTPVSANGWIIANMDQVKLHYTTIPTVKANGINEEKMYSWHNFLMGSCMLDVLAPGAVIRQPITFEA